MTGNAAMLELPATLQTVSDAEVGSYLRSVEAAQRRLEAFMRLSEWERRQPLDVVATEAPEEHHRNR